MSDIISNIDPNRVDSSSKTAGGKPKVRSEDPRPLVKDSHSEPVLVRDSFQLSHEDAARHQEILAQLGIKDEVRSDVVAIELEKLKENPRWPITEVVNGYYKDRMTELAHRLTREGFLL